MRLAAALDEFGRRYGIEGLGLDEAGQCALDLDDGRRLLIDYQSGDEALFLRFAFEVQDGLPDAALVRLYRRLLEANLLGQAIHGAVFSLDAEDEVVELHRRVPLDDRLVAEDLVGHLDALYGTAVRLAAELDLSFVSGDDPQGVLRS